MCLLENRLTIIEPHDFNEILYIRDFCQNNGLQTLELITDNLQIVFVIDSNVINQLKEDISGKVYDFMELINHA